VIDTTGKSDFGKVLDTNRAEWEEARFRQTVLAGLERLEERLAMLSEKVEETSKGRQLEQGLNSLRQYLIYILAVVVGLAIGLWSVQYA
jgi:hypothetical protein